MWTMLPTHLIVDYTRTTLSPTVVLEKDGQMLVVTAVYNFGHRVAIDGDDAAT